MKRRQNLIVGVLAAAITFGSLYAIAGEKRFSGFRERNHCGYYQNRDFEGRDWHQQTERPTIPEKNSNNIQ